MQDNKPSTSAAGAGAASPCTPRNGGVDLARPTPQAVRGLDDAGPAEMPLELGPVNAAEALALDAIAGARKLVGVEGAVLITDPEQDAYYFDTKSLKPLHALLQLPAASWIPVYSTTLKRIRDTGTAQPLERLRWYAGLIATPGILGRRLSRAARYKLARWPETEREFPRHFRIATAMLKDAVSAEEVAAASGVALDEVVDYINASYAAGRLATSRAAPDQPHPPDARTRASRLLAVLNKPLFAH